MSPRSTSSAQSGSATRQQQPQGAVERRGHTRTDVGGLWCDRGQVVDLSARGMRLISLRRWAEGQIRRVSITDGRRSITVNARCVWCRQEGMFSHSMGLAFEPASAEDERTLTAMAADHAVIHEEV